MRAFSQLRPQPWYRAQAFHAGLARAGYEVRTDMAPAQRGDVLLIWNRYGSWHDIATRFEAQGGSVLVAENGYLGIGGTSPKFDVHPGGPQPHHYYSLAIGWHNGRGRWPVGGPERLNALGVELKPWREGGEYVLVCANRSFGVGEQVMPADWLERTEARLRKEGLKVRTRPHPGNNEPKGLPLSYDLKGARAVVVWSSSVALHALTDGIPTFIEAPYQIVKGAGASGQVVAPVVPDRAPHFERMAWSQWRVDEIETGLPFSLLREMLDA